MKSPEEIGEVLKEARQKKGLTAEKVYKATRIQSKIIKALEEGKADEILNRVYVLLYLKKYASLLDLDGDGLAANYKTFYANEEKQILDIGKNQSTVNIEMQKWLTLAISAALIAIVIFFILFLGIKLRAYYGKRKKTIPAARAVTITKEVPAVETETQTIFPIPEDKPIELVLRSMNDVWMKVKKDGDVIFEDTLRKGAELKWSNANTIELWVGRAEALDFTINGKPIGRVGRGMIKSIHISREGLKVNNKWLIKPEQ